MTGRSDQRRPTPPRVGAGEGAIPFAAGISAIVLLHLAYYALTWRGFTAVVRVCPRLFCDFVDYFYPMGEAIFRTGRPVEGFLYSPFAAILLSVFPPLGLRASLVLWGGLQGLAVALCILLFRRLVPSRPAVQLLFVALMLGSFSFALNLMGGGVAVFTLAALLGMIALRRRGSRAGSGGLLAFAMSFKFYPILFVAPDIARRDARSLLGAAAACGAALFVIPGVLLGPAGTWHFYSALLDSFRASEWVTANVHSQYFPHVVVRLAGGAGYDAGPLLPLLRWIALGVAAANMGLVLLVQRARLRHADLWSFQLISLTIPFVLKTSWPHDLVFLPIAQALLAWWFLEWETADPAIGGAGERPDGTSRVTHTARTRAVALLLLPSIGMTNIVFFRLLGNFPAYGFCAFPFWADALLLVASYLVLAPPALRKLRAAASAASQAEAYDPRQ